MKRMIALLIVGMMFLSYGALTVQAAIIDPGNNSVEPCRVLIHPITGDQYSDAVFDTLTAAKNRFGWNWTYSSCSEKFLGTSYNYFYYFSDYTKQFFNVKYSDDEIIYNIPDDNIGDSGIK